MSYLEADEAPAHGSADFGFDFTRTDEGWRWTAYDNTGRVAAAGLAPNKAAAAYCVIQELART